MNIVDEMEHKVWVDREYTMEPCMWRVEFKTQCNNVSETSEDLTK